MSSRGRKQSRYSAGRQKSWVSGERLAATGSSRAESCAHRQKNGRELLSVVFVEKREKLSYYSQYVFGDRKSKKRRKKLAVSSGGCSWAC